MSVKVLHLIPSLSAGGAERQLSLLAPAMAAAGAKIAVAYGADGPNLPALQDGNVDLVALPRRKHHDPRVVTDIRRLILNWRPQLVQTWILQMDVMGGLAAHWAGVPHVLSERCSAALYTADWKNRLRQRIGRRASAIIANSQGGLDYWRGLGLQRNLHLVRNGVSPIVCSPPVNDLGLAGQPLLLAVGRLSEQKNIGVLIDAFNIALAELPAHHALILGEGPLRTSAEQRIAGSAAADRIHLGGVSKEVGWWLSRADAFVSASLFEGHPNVVIEAAAANCPLVLSEIAAHREVVDDNSALYAVPQDAAALGRRIVESVRDRSASQLRAASAHRAVAGLSFEVAAAKYLGIYRELLQ